MGRARMLVGDIDQVLKGSQEIPYQAVICHSTAGCLSLAPQVLRRSGQQRRELLELATGPRGSMKVSFDDGREQSYPLGPDG